MNALGSGGETFFRRAWRYIRWPLLVLVLAYIALLVGRAPGYISEQKSKETVALIQSRHITLADVDGKHLPLPPDPAKVDATVEGVDANQNGIRDDVELAIFKKYPNSPRIRAAELQYAMDLQLFLTKVTDSNTWKAAAIQEDRGYQCIGETYPRGDLKTFISVTDARTKEVEGLEFNIDIRKTAKQRAESFITSFGLPNSDFCDIGASTLVK